MLGPVTNQIQVWWITTVKHAFLVCLFALMISQPHYQTVFSQGFNETCTPNDTVPCAANLTCEANVCICDQGLIWSGSNCESLVGENCAADTQCVNTSVCDTTCKCPEKTYTMDNKTCVEQSLIGAGCDFDHQCINTSVCDTNICSCPAETYNLDNSTCVKQLDYGAICSGYRDECRVHGTSCQDDGRGGMRCICSNNHFWDSAQTACRDVNDLKVQNIRAVSESESTIHISWDQPEMNLISSFTYEIIGNGTIGQPSVQGVNISNLTNGTQYSYQVKTVVEFPYHGNMSTDEVTTEEIYTRQSHGGQCNQTIKCLTSSPLVCLNLQCRCPSQQRYSSGGCYGVSDIQVQNISAITNTTSATLKWSGSPIKSVKYNIVLQPQEGNIASGPSAEGATLTNLTQGRGYNATITSKVLADSIYEELSSEATHFFWMKPEKPLGEGQGERIAKNNYTFTFKASPGDVAKYQVNISSIISNSDISGIISNSETNSTTITGLRLLPAETYLYAIIAYNGNGDASETFSDNFTVNAERPGKVGELLVKGQTDSSLYVQWKTPSERNGNLIGYRITLSRKDRDKYCLELEIRCTNCLSKWPVSNESQVCMRYNASQKSSDELNEEGFVIDQNITTLAAYVNYTVKVEAVNEVGYGEPYGIIAQTDIGVAKEVVNITLNDLDVTWIPGEKTGPTRYEVVVREEDYRNRGSYNEILRENVIGYNNTTLRLRKVFAYWNYNISIQAHTDKGALSPIALNVKTPPKAPGLVIDFKVELDENDAQKIAISFRCPRITERNGNLLKYVVRKQWKQSMREQEETTEITHNENCFFSTTNFGPSLLEGIEYSFQVQAINDYSDGMFNGAIKRLIEPKGSSDGAPIGAIIGGIIAVIVIVLLVLGALYFLRRRKIPRAQRRNSDIVDPGPSVRKERPINIRRFGEALATYHKDANLCFQDDFEDIKKLSSDLKHASDEAKREENRVKNRYVNILPYDFSRVKLSILSDEHETMDFINANYIPGFNSVREYIATQGPMYCTIPDFWRMMWEQNSKIIVMLSDLQEAGKRKVDLYWPENLNEPINYGNIVVEMTNFSQLNKYTIRNFKISWGENEPRRVTHFFLAGWMDFSANLKYSDVLEFAKLVRQEATPANSGPIVVHCSAGVGRTGTFIALDYFMQHLDRYGLDFEIDIFSYVMRMRYHRPSMVQAETQYVFIYDALYEVIKQKLKEEEERMYDNNVRPGSNVYVNVPLPSEEESIYLNMNGQSNSDNSHVYENQAFEPESGIEDDKPTKGEKTPTTAL